MISKTPSVLLQKIASKADLEPDEIENAYPCTTLQASLLAANLQGIGSYVSTFAFDISALPYQPQDVKKAVETLYDATPILRTRFIQSKGSFLQVVASTPLAWSEHDNLEEFLELDSKQEVRLGDGLANFAWIDGPDSHIHMIWSLHHALYDEWSINLLFKDLSLLLTSPERFVTRPNFSRFVKAQNLVNRNESERFWADQFQKIESYTSLLPDTGSLGTSRQIEFSGPLNLTHKKHQPSTLAIAAWSILVSKLFKSKTVLFGNIVNGRTANVSGIVDICGPTMTTVPYVVTLSEDQPISAFLDSLEETRNKMLPYEQAGLAQYRQATGSGRFDTLLSIRSVHTGDEVGQELRPSTAKGRQIHHPCCIYLDIVFKAEDCTLKASFDEHYVDSDKVGDALQTLSMCLQYLDDNSNTQVNELSGSVKLPDLMKFPDGSQNVHTVIDEQESPVDAGILDIVRKTAQNISPLQVDIVVNPDTSLRQLGLDSLSTVVFARQLGEAFKISVPFREVTGLRKTMLDVARSLQKALQGTEKSQATRINLLDLAQQHVKDFTLSEMCSSAPKNLDCILLTGASGYVGIEILRQLLASCDNHIVLLVRCKTPENGLERICETATMARWQEKELKSIAKRVEIWPSDLGASSLGLDKTHVDRFKTIRTIIHNGARVDFSLDYDDLAPTNVSTTAFLLKHHLRSISNPSFVYVTGGRGCPLDFKESTEVTASTLAAAGGYAQTKFVSEILLHRAQDLCHHAGRRSAISIVHPGAVIGSNDTGVANTDDFLWRYVAASVRMRAYVPAVPTKREWINLMSVDAVAQEIVSAALKPRNGEKVHRRLMRSGLSVAKFWEIVVKTLGSSYELEPVSEWEWLQRLKGALDNEGVEHPLFALSQLLLQGSLKGIGGTGLRAEQIPRDEDLSVNEEVVVSNVKYLEEVGFFSGEMEGAHTKEVFKRSRR